MMLRRKPKADPAREHLVAGLERQAKRVQAEIYAEGVKHGIEMALAAVLGEDRGGAPGYKGPLPSELREWAVAALAMGSSVDVKAVAAEAVAATDKTKSPAGGTT